MLIIDQTPSNPNIDAETVSAGEVVTLQGVGDSEFFLATTHFDDGCRQFVSLKNGTVRMIAHHQSVTVHDAALTVKS